MEEQDINSWVELKRAFCDYVRLRGDFLKKKSAIDFIRNALSVPEERGVAISLVASYPAMERIVFFSQLVSLASYVNGFTEESRELILKLPREWVMERIEDEVSGILVSADYEEYRCLLELCCELSRDLMIKFAKQALASEDEDIKEAGADYLSR
ncbi:hypothetical protein [Burkholderia territorii]|uniref:hypothetical protein n=1 Tax=Burkholderia territorii TaxID=1503055 RepID=UPI0012D94F19|nr:hypothetical protein [Burkholderia territorii]